MSANKWGFYRDRNTGRTGEYPCDVARLFDNLEPVESADCADCKFGDDEIVVDKSTDEIVVVAPKPSERFKVADKDKDK